MKRIASALALALLALPMVAGRPSAQQVTVTDVTKAAASYLTQYSQRLQAVGAEEDFLQLEVSGGRMRLTRRLTSDVAFVGVGLGRVIMFRDVLLKDNNPIREREPRLLKLLEGPQELDPLLKAQQFFDDSVRHYVSQNVGLFDEMLAPLALLRTENAPKVRFRLENIKTTDGVRVASLRFTETTAPHVINSPIDEPATGRILVEVGTGIVRQTELVMSNKHVNLRVTVAYAPEPTLALWLPSKMTFQSDLSSLGAGNKSPGTVQSYDVRESLEGLATYSKFKQVPVKFNVRRPSAP